MRHTLLAVMAVMVFVVPVQAQTVPEQLDTVLMALSNELGENIGFANIDDFSFTPQTFDSTSLGCPDPNAFYVDMVVQGFEFEVTYAGDVYIYRVAADETIVQRCDRFTAPPETSPCAAVVTVRQGDTLSAISRRCGVAIDTLARVNNIDDPTRIFVGQQLSIPGGGDFAVNTVGNVPIVSVFPVNAPVGSTLNVTVNGFPANAEIVVGFGQNADNYIEERTIETDGFGGAFTQLTVPGYAATSTGWLVIAETEDGSVRTVSNVVFTGANLFTEADIYLISLGTAPGGEGLGCGDEVVAVPVNLEPTVAPLRGAFTVLLGGDFDVDDDLYNALAGSALTFEEASILGGRATVRLRGNLPAAGTCDVPRIIAQLRQTALQFSTVHSVEILVNGQPLDDVLSVED
ncbi:MAG: LysM peptidoglycan-binding domain-containing protein [Chloroflexota bacterium]